jgi:hypothetical protein
MNELELHLGFCFKVIVLGGFLVGILWGKLGWFPDLGILGLVLEREGRPRATPVQAALRRLDYGVAGVTVELVWLVSVTPLTLTSTTPTVVAPAGTVPESGCPCR